MAVEWKWGLLTGGAQLLTCSFLVQYAFPSLPENLYWGVVIGSQDNVVSPTAAPRSPSEPVPQAPALWIETTAYALLHLLLREGKGEMADKAASWLTHQGSFHGAFRSTQVGAATGLGVGGPEPKFPTPGLTSLGHCGHPGCPVCLLDHFAHHRGEGPQRDS